MPVVAVTTERGTGLLVAARALRVQHGFKRRVTSGAVLFEERVTLGESSVRDGTAGTHEAVEHERCRGEKGEEKADQVESEMPGDVVGERSAEQEVPTLRGEGRRSLPRSEN